MQLQRWLSIFLLGGLAHGAQATDYSVLPSPQMECQDRLSAALARLKPGDTLRLGAGRYRQSCNRSVTVRGTIARPITIYAGINEQAIIYRGPEEMGHLNNLELVNSEHVILRGLHILGGSIGLRIMGGHHLVFADGRVTDTGTTAIAINYSDVHKLTIRNTEIARTGLAGASSGEGIYAGCHDGSCVVTDSQFIDNRIHDLRGNRAGGNDGIEIKVGSGGNIVRGNRIDNTLIDAEYPCILAYGGGRHLNLIENNLLSNCGEAIQVVADAVVRNNIIYQASIAGIVSAAHERNRNTQHVYIVNNTVIDAPVCAKLDWRHSHHMVFANNALFCASTVALEITAKTNGLLLYNAWAGTLKGIDFRHPGLFPVAAHKEEL